MTGTATPPIDASTTMREVLLAFPGAQRALFAKYHIGGCRSCAFHPGETLAQLCARNDGLPVDEVIAHIRESHRADQHIFVEPIALKQELEGGRAPRLVDVRTREEFETVKLPGASLFGEGLIRDVFGSWTREEPIVVYDHTGERSLDAAAYLAGHGFGNVRCLRGGIDAYSREADASLPRYRVELD